MGRGRRKKGYVSDWARNHVGTKFSVLPGPRSDPQRGLRRALGALCTTELVSWGVLYYAFPVMLTDLTRSTGWSTGTGMGAFSFGLVVAALAGIPIGRLLDRHGPRPLMTGGSILGVGAALAIATAPSLAWFFAAWGLAGLAQAALLYPPAFAALTRWYGPDRVPALTTLTLVAGFASTIFAPLTATLVAQLGWRMAYVVLAAILGAVTIPLHLFFLTPAWPGAESPHPRQRFRGHTRAVLHARAFSFLLVAMALVAFGMYAATVNLVPLLTSRGIDNTIAAVAFGLLGAGQVLGRLGYGMLTRWTSPLVRTVAVSVTGAVTVALLGALPGSIAALIIMAVIAGAVRGIYTLLQATAVSDRWGTRDFATLNGIFNAPITAAIAVAPAGGALLAGWLASYQSAFFILAILVLAGAVCAVGSRAQPVPG